jgi:hypothetical protein
MNRWRKTKENGYYNTSKGGRGGKIIIRKKISNFSSSPNQNTDGRVKGRRGKERKESCPKDTKLILLIGFKSKIINKAKLKKK